MRRTGILLTALFALFFFGCGGEPPAADPVEAPAAEPEVSEAEALIARSIAYHDPDGLWDTARIELEIAESRPEGADRRVVLTMTPGQGAMIVERVTDESTTLFEVTGDDIMRREADGSSEMAEDALAEHGLDDERVMRLRNYYLFLWGLPMKLRDPGTIVDPSPTAATFDEQDALEVRITYDPEVGGDTWYFYFAPDTARLIGYRFYHDEAANDGEYIHLAGEIESGGLRLPASRSWYFHQGDRYLGEDTATSLTVTP